MAVPAEGTKNKVLSSAELLELANKADQAAPLNYSAPQEDPLGAIFDQPEEEETNEKPSNPNMGAFKFTRRFTELGARPGIMALATAREFDALSRNSFVFSYNRELGAAYMEKYGSPIGDPDWRHTTWSPSETQMKAAAQKHNLLPDDYTQLAFARSEEDLEIRAEVLGSRRENEAYVAANYTGIGGFGAQMGVAMMDPTFLLTGGVVGSAFNGVKTASSAGRVLKNMAAAGIADGSIEFANAALDPMSTYQDAILATVGSAALTGVFSGVGEALTYKQAKAQRKALKDARQSTLEAIADKEEGSEPGTAGAKQRKPVFRSLVDEEGNSLLDADLEEDDVIWNVLDPEEGIPEQNTLPSFGAPVRSVGRAPVEELRGLGALVMEDPTKPNLQRQTAAEKAHRVHEAGGVYLRRMQDAGKNYWRARGKTSMFGGVSPARQEEFDRYVHMVVTRVKGLPEEILNDPDILEAVQAFREGSKENLFLLQNRDYVMGSGRDGEWKPRVEPEKPVGTTPVDPQDPPSGLFEPDAPQAEGAPPKVESDSLLDGSIEGNKVDDVKTANRYFGRKSFRSEGRGGPRPSNPPSEKLDMETEARTQRAKEMGFDTERVFYHGTSKTFDEFQASERGVSGPGIYLTNDPAEAGAYTNAADAAQVIPLYVRGKLAPIGKRSEIIAKHADEIESRANQEALEANDFMREDAIFSTAFDRIANEKMAEEGYAGLIQFEDNMSTQLVIFDPANVRSVYAKFDPELTDSRNLSAKSTTSNTGLNDGADSALEWLQQTEEFDRAAPSGEASSKELNKGTAEGALVGGLVGGAAGGSAGAIASLFTDDDQRYAAGVLGAVLMATAGAAGRRGSIRASRRAQLARWKARYPRAGLFVNETSEGVDLDALSKAKEMEAKGVDRDVIWKKTLWGKSPSGEWITENTTSTEYKPYPYNLEIDQQLLQDYPELHDVLVSEVMLSGSEGSYFPAFDGKPARIEIDTNLPEGKKLAALFHELQHAVQETQGRQSGTNLKAVQGVREYLRAQGEVEARSAEVRLGKSKTWRRNNPPWAGLDVPEDEIFTPEGAAKFSDKIKDDLRAMRTEGWLEENSRYSGFDDEGREVWEIDLPDTDDGIVFRLAPYDDGVFEAEWDFMSNAKDPETEMAILEGRAKDGVKAFEAVNQQVQALLAQGEHPVLMFTGLTNGHARQQRKLMANRNPDDYQAVHASYATSRGEKSIFAFVRNNVTDMEATLQRFYSKNQMKLTGLDKKAPEGSLSIKSISPTLLKEQGPYTGVKGMEGIPVDETYAKRSFNKEGFDQAMLLPNGKVKIKNELADAIHSHPVNRDYFDELARKRGKDPYELVRSVAGKYIRTLETLMNDAEGSGSPYRPHSKASQMEAKAIVRREMEGVLGKDAEDAMEFLLELLAPVKEADLPNFAKTKLKLDLDYNKHSTILNMFDWNASKAFATSRRNIAGHVGFNAVGINDVKKFDSRIERIRRDARKDPANQKAIADAADKLERVKKAVMGETLEANTTQQTANSLAVIMKRLNMARLLNNVAFSMFGEIGLAATTAGPVRWADTVMGLRKFRKALRDGNYEEADSWVAMADDMMGHGTSQVRSRLASSVSERGVVDNYSLDESGPIWRALDTSSRKAANLTARLSGMAPITETLRLAIATNLAKKFYRSAMKGKMPFSVKRMRDLGIDEDMWSRISENLKNMGTTVSPDTGRKLPDFDRNWADPQAFEAFVAAIDRKTRRLNMDVGVGHSILAASERPYWGAFLQFLQFPQGALLKHTGNSLAYRDPTAAVGLLAAAGFSTLGVYSKIYMQAATIKDEKERKEFMDKQLEPRKVAAKAIYYTPHAAHIPTLVDVSAAALGQDPVFSQARNTDLATLGANPLASNPTSDFINKVLTTPSKLTDGVTQEDLHDFVRLFPLGNHLMVQALTDEVAQYLPEEED